MWVKKCVKICIILFKNWKLFFENTNQTTPIIRPKLTCFFFFLMNRDPRTLLLKSQNRHQLKMMPSNNAPILLSVYNTSSHSVCFWVVHVRRIPSSSRDQWVTHWHHHYRTVSQITIFNNLNLKLIWHTLAVLTATSFKSVSLLS